VLLLLVLRLLILLLLLLLLELRRCCRSSRARQRPRGRLHGECGQREVVVAVGEESGASA
jgi:hypothetical protein